MLWRYTDVLIARNSFNFKQFDPKCNNLIYGILAETIVVVILSTSNLTKAIFHADKTQTISLSGEMHHLNIGNESK